jgi:hypothetical protein
VPSITTEPVSWEAERAELQAVLQSNLFTRSPTLTHLLSYLCEKTFAGESAQIKEYSVGLDVFDRRDSFDQDTDSIVRVQANRLRKRLSEYYASEGAAHPVRITIPVGQYIPVFKTMADVNAAAASNLSMTSQARAPDGARKTAWRPSLQQIWMLGTAVILVVVTVVLGAFLARNRSREHPVIRASNSQQASPEPAVGLPVGEEVRILAGASRKYVDHAGKLMWIMPASFGVPTLASPAATQFKAQSSTSGGRRIPSSIAAAERAISLTTFL